MLTLKYSVDKAQLEKMYMDGMTGRQIGELLGIPHRTIGRYLKASGVTLRNPGDPAIPELADRDWLETEYHRHGKSTTQIAAELNCAACAVANALRRAGIAARSTGSTKGHTRTTEASRAKQSAARRDKYLGSDNPNWKGGTAFKDPDRGRYRAKMWTKAVKDRDGWQCVECKSTQKLHAHHIKRWRDYPSLRYDVANGVTLCHPCHEAAHGRGFKFRWFQVRRKTQERAAP